MKLIRLAGASALTAILLTACGRQESPSASRHTGPPVDVRAKAVALETHQATEDVVGTVRSKQRAVIEAKVSGRILQYLVTPGQMVKSGERLAELDTQETRAKWEQAAALLEQADREMARYKKLIASNATSRQEYDAVESRQKVARAALSEAGIMLGYAWVTAPFDSVITRKLADVGDLAMPGKPLMEIEAPGSLRFEADLPEAILDRVKLGAKMRVKVAAVPQALEATVSEIAPVADVVSRTFQVKFDLPGAGGLRTGQFGRVSVPVAETRLLRVPVESVLKRGQMELVYVVRDQHAALRLVRTGKVLDGDVEILSGLEEGDPVIVSDVTHLADGQSVTVRP